SASLSLLSVGAVSSGAFPGSVMTPPCSGARRQFQMNASVKSERDCGLMRAAEFVSAYYEKPTSYFSLIYRPLLCVRECVCERSRGAGGISVQLWKGHSEGKEDGGKFG
ncbi:uncharacterized, partial [Tachysurus ichikawai]